MTKSIAFLFSVSVVWCWSGASAFGQGKAAAHVPPVHETHSQAGAQSHAKPANSGQHGPQSSTHDTRTTWQTKFAERMHSSPEFQTRIQTLLPAGMDPTAAASGFKNQGQFIAALHVSRNLNIPFDQLKAKMTGMGATSGTQTGSTEPMSLGKAIQELRPAMTESETNAAAKQATSQAATTQNTGPTT
jgi:hypothetical protein